MSSLDLQRPPVTRLWPSLSISRRIAKIHFEELQAFLDQHLVKEPFNSRSSAREKLTRLTKQQFQELSTDVYDELVRLNNNTLGNEVLSLPLRDEFHPKRNQARQKLSTLPKSRFKDLAGDVFFELGRRYPEFKKPEVSLDATPSPRSNYDELSSLNYRERPLPPLTPPLADQNIPHSARRPSVDDTASIFTSGPLASIELSSLNYRERPLPPLTPPLADQNIPHSARRPSVDDTASISTSGPLASIATSGVVSVLPEDSSTQTPEPFSKYSSLCLDGQIKHRSRYVVASGGYADVWTGSFGSSTVAIKITRSFSSIGTPIEKSKLLKRLWREYLVWSCLSHPNILECLGFSYDFTPESEYEIPCLISYWMANGNVLSYIKKYPNAIRMDLRGGIANGLSYLHHRDPAIVHGDLRAGNVLVSDAGVPYLTDFGLSRILNDTRGMTTSSEVAGSLRWMAPELLYGEKMSEKSDVWAYGMTILEILSGRRPYHELNLEPMVMRRIIDARAPSRPVDDEGHPTLPDWIWTLCLRCWHPQPMQRPPMHEVLRELIAEHDL